MLRWCIVFFPNWSGFSDIVFSLGLILVFLALIAFVSTFLYMDGMNILLTFASFCIVAGALALAVGYFTEIGIHHPDQVRNREEQQARRDLKQQGFKVVEVGLGGSWASIKSHNCLWEYELGQRNGKYVMLRGSGTIVSSPPVKPSEVGRDDPNLVCTNPA